MRFPWSVKPPPKEPDTKPDDEWYTARLAEYVVRDFNQGPARNVIPPRLPCGGGCARCERAWGRNVMHCTPLDPGRSVFVLCEECWCELSPLERLPYYQALWVEWVASGATDHSAYYPGKSTFGERLNSITHSLSQWEPLERAVLNEPNPEVPA